MPLSWKVLLSGYAPEYVYDNGRLDRSLSFKELRQRSLINARRRISRAASEKGCPDSPHADACLAPRLPPHVDSIKRRTAKATFLGGQI